MIFWLWQFHTEHHSLWTFIQRWNYVVLINVSGYVLINVSGYVHIYKIWWIDNWFTREQRLSNCADRTHDANISSIPMHQLLIPAKQASDLVARIIETCHMSLINILSFKWSGTREEEVRTTDRCCCFVLPKLWVSRTVLYY